MNEIKTAISEDVIGFSNKLQYLSNLCPAEILNVDGKVVLSDKCKLIIKDCISLCINEFEVNALNSDFDTVKTVLKRITRTFNEVAKSGVLKVNGITNYFIQLLEGSEQSDFNKVMLDFLRTLIV
ncbi:MAG: hypothetical protein LBJ23_07260 [Tannerella sp.]|jgi:hypothetical protein|nr:hypothetical protein [Tannerella sp.]